MNPSAVLHEAENSTSSVSHIVLMDGFLATNNFFCGVVGIPLNVLIAAFIVFTRRLHKTRNIVWLGVAFSNVLVLFQHLIEFYAYCFQSETAKTIFNLVIGLPYASLLLNLFFSLIDRYVSIAHSAWYKRKVTITWIVSGQIALFSIICTLMKGPYLLEIFPFPPRITNTELKLFSVTGFFISLLCVFGQVFVYSKIKYFLRLEKDMDLSSSTDGGALNRQGKNKHQTTEIMGKELPREPKEENSVDEDLRHAAATYLQKPAVTPSPFFIRIGDQSISRLELKAARHALDSVTMLFLFFLPAFVPRMLAVYADCSAANRIIGQECSTYLWILTYTRGLMVFYTIVSPIFFFIRSPDLSQALNRSVKI